jgi:hypothetical protein
MLVFPTVEDESNEKVAIVGLKPVIFGQLMTYSKEPNDGALYELALWMPFAVKGDGKSPDRDGRRAGQIEDERVVVRIRVVMDTVAAEEREGDVQRARSGVDDRDIVLRVRALAAAAATILVEGLDVGDRRVRRRGQSEAPNRHPESKDTAHTPSHR